MRDIIGIFNSDWSASGWWCRWGCQARRCDELR